MGVYGGRGVREEHAARAARGPSATHPRLGSPHASVLFLTVVTILVPIVLEMSAKTAPIVSLALVQRDISVVMRPFHASGMLLRECHRPFVLLRPTTAPTATPKRELSLMNAMGQLDACDRDGRIRE
jgi:hypothetical protein